MVQIHLGPHVSPREISLGAVTFLSPVLRRVRLSGTNRSAHTQGGTMPSFDVVSEFNMQDVRDAVDQAAREISQRYDFKNTNSQIELGDGEVKLASISEDRLTALRQVLEEKFAKRKISMKVLEYGNVEQASGNTVRQSVSLVSGISSEKAKELNKEIKAMGIKGVQSSTQGDQLRVTAKKRDALQDVIAALKAGDFGIPLQYNNFRD